MAEYLPAEPFFRGDTPDKGPFPECDPRKGPPLVPQKLYTVNNLLPEKEKCLSDYVLSF